ncbi:MAG: hypothetical protein WEC13_01790 [Burkholderiales bacterium]
MSPKLQRLHDEIEKVLGVKPVERLGELTLETKDYKSTAIQLRDHPDLRFEELIDLCGIDYQTYGDRPREGGRSTTRKSRSGQRCARELLAETA